MENNLEELRKVFVKKPISLAFLFGSRIQGNVNNFSDYDIAILIEENFYQKNNINPPTILNLKMDLLDELFRFFKSENVDLIILNEAPIFLQYKIIRYGKLIFSPDLSSLYRFKAQVVSEFLDFSSIFNFYCKSLNKKYGVLYDG